jgi:hypothetical protein
MNALASLECCYFHYFESISCLITTLARCRPSFIMCVVHGIVLAPGEESITQQQCVADALVATGKRVRCYHNPLSWT